MPTTMSSDAALGQIGKLLEQIFAELCAQPLPSSFDEVLARLEAAEAARATPLALSDTEFKVQLSALLPQLRAFGRSLAGNRDAADDLVQETLLKAWAARDRFQAGTNMRAWTFIILRNLFLSQMRRARFSGDYNELQAERLLTAPASQHDSIHLADLQRAMLTLPPAQREALILVGAGGLPYEEAAAICNVPIGTIKSRVARARAALELVMAGAHMPSRSDAAPTVGGSALDQIIGEVEALGRG